MKFSYSSWLDRFVQSVECIDTYPCEQGKIQLRFTYETSALRAALGQNASERILFAQGSEILPKITSYVQIIVKASNTTGGQMSARFSAEECSAILEGKWPNTENYSRVERAVREKKSYPMPEPEIPGGGGKSMTAQGQTKKDGSHSHDRHR